MDKANKRRKHAFRDGTWKNQETQINKYLKFCEKFGKDPVKPSDDLMSAYVEHLAESFSSQKSVMNYVMGVKTWHRRKGIEWEGFHSYKVKNTLRALKNTMRERPCQKPPLSVPVMESIVRGCAHMGKLASVYMFLFVAMFFGMLS